MSLNHISLVGSVAQTPESRVTPSGIPTATFQIAVKRPPRQEGGSDVFDYLRVITWRQVSERLMAQVKKGDLVAVEGRLNTRTFETQTGQKKKVVEVEATNVTSISSGSSSNVEDHSGYAEMSESDPWGDFSTPAAAAPLPSSSAGFAPPPMDLDDEIPF